MNPPLAIRDLRFTFPGQSGGVDVPAFSLEVGEQVLLTGPSGCGKSTLLNLIAGLLTADVGSIEIAGRDIQRLPQAGRDRLRGGEGGIGMVFQTFNLLGGFSAIENVMLAMMFSGRASREHRPAAAGLLDRLGLTAAEHERVVERLSIGQQQRVAVARALACNPVLVLADEPTASLDPDNAAAAVELLTTACRASRAALLCVSHDVGLAPHFGRRVGFSELSAGVAPQGLDKAGVA